MSNRNFYYYCLLAILIVTATIDIQYYTGFVGNSDDSEYFLGAQKILTGLPAERPRPTWIGPIRLGVVLPLTLFYSITGQNIDAACYLFLCFHLGLVAVTFFIGKLLYGRKAGLLAALIVAFSPLCYIFTTSILPDNSLAFWIALSLYFLIKGSKGLYLATDSENSPYLYFWSGLFLGVGYLVKATALIMIVPAAAIILLASPTIWSANLIKSYISYGVGFLIIFLMEKLIIYAVYGELISRLDRISDNPTWIQHASTQGFHPFGRILNSFLEVSQYMPVSALVFIATMILFPFVSKTKKGISLWLFGVWSVLYLTIGSVKLSVYAPPVLDVRYYVIAIPAVSIMLAWMLIRLSQYLKFRAALSQSGISRFAVYLVWLIFPLIAAFELHANTKFIGNYYNAAFVRSTIEAKEYAYKNYPDLPIVISKYSSKYLWPIFFNREKGKVFIPETPIKELVDDIPSPPFILFDSSYKIYRDQRSFQNNQWLEKHLKNLLGSDYKRNFTVSRINEIYTNKDIRHEKGTVIMMVKAKK